MGQSLGSSHSAFKVFNIAENWLDCYTDLCNEMDFVCNIFCETFNQNKVICKIDQY